MKSTILKPLSASLCLALSGALFAADSLDRTSLPIPEPDYPRSTVLDARDAKAPPRFEIKAPEGAPNVLIVLVDDMGFGMPSAFGGPVRMPSADRLAKEGLRYNQFHTTAVCSPTRTALLSARRAAGARAARVVTVSVALLRKSRRFMVGSGCGASLGARFQGLDRQAREARRASTTRPENVRESGGVKSGYALCLNQSGNVRAEPGKSVRGGNE